MLHRPTVSYKNMNPLLNSDYVNAYSQLFTGLYRSTLYFIQDDCQGGILNKGHVSEIFLLFVPAHEILALIALVSSEG